MAAIASRRTGATPGVPFLLRLYPATWRRRYGDEFVELLQSRPPSLRDHVDIFQGALDARIHPQVVDALPPRVATGGDRLLALAAVTVGALLSGWAWIIVAASPRWGGGMAIDEGLMGAAFGAGFLGAAIAMLVMVSMTYRYVHELGSVSAIGSLIVAAGFLSILGEAEVLGFPLLTVGAVLLGRGLARVVGWRVSAIVVVSTVFMAAAMFGFVTSNGQQLLWLWMLAVYGPSWILLGINLRRGPRVAHPVPVGA
ncbi:MAG: hypothetical protein ABIR64_05995 [Candidatus Limnocylindrales bacterium]